MMKSIYKYYTFDTYMVCIHHAKILLVPIMLLASYLFLLSLFFSISAPMLVCEAIILCLLTLVLSTF